MTGQYKWTIGVCITVHIGERGQFTDVQICEQRVNKPYAWLMVYSTTDYSLYGGKWVWCFWSFCIFSLFETLNNAFEVHI